MTIDTPSFVLASRSPRRKALLENLGINFNIYPSNIEEVLNDTLTPNKLVVKLSHQKASEVAIQFPEKIVIGADTIVVLDGEILGKPIDEKHAVDMLRKLSGQTHSVF
ncbi:MAG TPA: hypothetical protein EYO96_02435, partial [Candidatus Marinimicrobia bacterium]|nr:hypothetical protein [Candidatus Neomarinimicrobiota bacterium]